MRNNKIEVRNITRDSKFRDIKFNLFCDECKSVIKKARGLMFSKPKCLIFFFNKESNVVLHMFFVFFKIIIIGLDKNKKIVDIKLGKPFDIYIPIKNSKYIIEIPFGFIKDKNIKDIFQVGDKLEFKEQENNE